MWLDKGSLIQKRKINLSSMSKMCNISFLAKEDTLTDQRLG